jgi:hypothetical protein
MNNIEKQLPKHITQFISIYLKTLTDTLSKQSCNDFDLPDSWSEEQKNEFMSLYCAWDNDITNDENYEDAFPNCDWCISGYIKDNIEKTHNPLLLDMCAEFLEGASDIVENINSFMAFGSAYKWKLMQELSINPTSYPINWTPEELKSFKSGFDCWSYERFNNNIPNVNTINYLRYVVLEFLKENNAEINKGAVVDNGYEIHC